MFILVYNSPYKGEGKNTATLRRLTILPTNDYQ